MVQRIVYQGDSDSMWIAEDMIRMGGGQGKPIPMRYTSVRRSRMSVKLQIARSFRVSRLIQAVVKRPRVQRLS